MSISSISSSSLSGFRSLQRTRSSAALPAVPRRHFSAGSEDGGVLPTFPKYLLSHEYYLNENLDLVPSKSHIIGSFVHDYDFRYWDSWGTVTEEDEEVTETFLKNVRSIAIGSQTDLAGLKQLLKRASENVTSLTIEESVIVSGALASLSWFEHLRSIEIRASSTLRLNDSSIIGDVRYSEARDESLPNSPVKGSQFSQSISDTSPPLSDQLFSNLLLGLKEIAIMRLAGCSGIGNESLSFISNRFKDIVEINLSGNLRISNAGLHQIVEKCQNLEIIDISGCLGITHFGLINRIDTLLQYFARPWKSLRCSNCPVDAETLDWIASALHDMAVCDLAGVPGITDAVINALVINSPKLKFLGISKSDRVTSNGLLMIAKCCSSLHEVKASAVDQFEPSKINLLVNNNNFLSVLDLSANPRLEEGIFVGFTKSTVLVNLNISGTNISSSGFRRIVECCPLLKTLNISGLRDISDSALSYVGVKCQFLENFYADDCTALTDNGVSDLLLSCRALRVLSLASSTAYVRLGVRFGQYTDQLLEAVLKHGKLLRELNLRNQCAIRFNTPWLLGR
jgi:hypothetical protein